MTGNPAGNLRDVKSVMNSLGWTNNGGPGSVKLDSKGRMVASHGDKVWEEDVERATTAVARQKGLSPPSNRKPFGGGGKRFEG